MLNKINDPFNAPINNIISKKQKKLTNKVLNNISYYHLFKGIDCKEFDKTLDELHQDLNQLVSIELNNGNKFFPFTDAIQPILKEIRRYGATKKQIVSLLNLERAYDYSFVGSIDLDIDDDDFADIEGDIYHAHSLILTAIKDYYSVVMP